MKNIIKIEYKLVEWLKNIYKRIQNIEILKF